MNLSRTVVVALVFGSIVTLMAARQAQAQTRVGEAVLVKNEVVRVAASSATQINVGDSLLRDEVVRKDLSAGSYCKVPSPCVVIPPSDMWPELFLLCGIAMHGIDP